MGKFVTAKSGAAYFGHQRAAVKAPVIVLVAVTGGIFLGYLFRDAALLVVNQATTSVATSFKTRIVITEENAVQLPQVLQVRPYQGDPEGCVEPKLDIKGLEDYGCKILHKVCFDQNKMIWFDAPPDMDIPYPMFSFGWQPSIVPGYDQKQVKEHTPDQQQPLVRRNSSHDRPDLKNPIFSRCHTPLVWNSPWAVQFAEFELNSFVPLWYMQQELKLIDNNVMLVPLMDGFEAPAFMEFLLRPYTDGIIATFHEVSSRRHMYNATFPRCFETVAVCGLKHMYNARPPPKFKKSESDKDTTYGEDPEWKVYHPSKAGRFLVYYYTAKGVLQPPTINPEVLKVVVANRTGPFRRFLELDKFLEACNAWKPPEVQGGVKRLQCEGWTFGGGNVADAQKLQEIDVLITHHGAELNQGFFMRFGTSVIEVRPKDFDGFWPDVYMRSISRQESLIFYWQARVKVDANSVPTDWEAQGIYKIHGIKMGLNRHSIPRWPLYQPILEAIVRTNRSREAYLARPFKDLIWDV